MIAALLVELLVHDATLAATVLLRFAEITQTQTTRGERCEDEALSAPTTPVFLNSLIAGIVGILVAQGVVPDFGVRGFWPASPLRLSAVCGIRPGSGALPHRRQPLPQHRARLLSHINPVTGEIWLCGTGTDSMLRFDPNSETFVEYRIPTRVTYTREIELDAEGNAWTTSSNGPTRHI